ncbi:MAG TPA: CDP-alcohol phosphatidyltransferase family protein [Chloroflexi bacterium]|nr:CDP-alcohol phosphatidyltransferase family protein [Chloroflexota bacterium]
MKMSQSESESPKKVTFTDRMRVVTKPIIDPVVTFLAKYKISPDVLTVLGMLFHFLFAWLIAIGEFTWAGVAMLFMAPLDALDGSLARKLGRKQGGFGAYLDSVLDRLAEVILFGGFIYYYYAQGNDLMLAVAYVAISGSLLVSDSRGKAESLGYEAKVGIGSRVERYFLMIVFLIIRQPQIALGILAVITYITVAQRMYAVWKQWITALRAEEAQAAQTAQEAEQ